MYVGLDVHKRYCYYAMVDGRGTEVKKDRFRTTSEELEEFASALPEGSQVAIEASASGCFVYEQLDEQGIEVHLAHPTMVRPFAKQHVKTDKVDAIVLAQLLRMDYLPESYVPGEEMRDLRTPKILARSIEQRDLKPVAPNERTVTPGEKMEFVAERPEKQE